MSESVKLLIVTKAQEYQHASQPALVETLRELGQTWNWRVSLASNELFEFDNAKSLIEGFDVVFFAQTSGNILTDKQLESLKTFSETPRHGIVGWHASADTHRNDKRFTNIFGAAFTGHPVLQKGRVSIDQKVANAVGLELPESLELEEEEFYNFSANVATESSLGFKPFIFADENSYVQEYEKPEWEHTRMGAPHPLAWHRDINHCRSFYCGLGHSVNAYKNMTLRRILAASVNWASFKRELNTEKALKCSVNVDTNPMGLKSTDHRVELAVVKTSVDHFPVVISHNAILDNETMARVVPSRYHSSTHFLIADSRVNEIYGDETVAALRASGVVHLELLVVPHGEESKSLKHFSELVDRVLTSGVDKHSTIISLGGGMINNLAGMVAATVYRGLRLVHIGSSLLGQVDAAVGIKQAVNWGTGKNQLGALYAPSLVILDTHMLKTLPMREKINGMGEAIKHALAQDTEFLRMLMQHSVEDLDDLEFLHQVVKTSADKKCLCLNSTKQVDTTEMIMQYGHALGHAIEHLSRYALRHGEAISIGMTLCCEIAIIVGHGDPVRLEQLLVLHQQVFTRYQLPWRVPEEMKSEDICDILAHDKHYLHSTPTMMTLKDIGVPYEDLGGNTGLPVSYNVITQALEANRARSFPDKH